MHKIIVKSCYAKLNIWHSARCHSKQWLCRRYSFAPVLWDGLFTVVLFPFNTHYQFFAYFRLYTVLVFTSTFSVNSQLDQELHNLLHQLWSVSLNASSTLVQLVGTLTVTCQGMKDQDKKLTDGHIEAALFWSLNQCKIHSCNFDLSDHQSKTIE